VNLSINGKYLAKNKLIATNNLEAYSDVFEAKDEILELTSECKENCDYSISILNAIEITPYESGNENLSSRIEKQTRCGNSIEGGRCDKGPDVLNCLFDDPTISSAKYCNGEYALLSIPREYQCSDQFGKYKCVKKVYSDSSECKLNCPKKCKDEKCIY
jgi:hypothetical protein